jgi:hypothetical protein
MQLRLKLTDSCLYFLYTDVKWCVFISFQKDFLSFHSGHTISKGSISNCLPSDSKTDMWKRPPLQKLLIGPGKAVVVILQVC